jgi:hypothetical protein
MKEYFSEFEEKVLRETSAAIESKKTRRISDGKGLMLVIRPNGKSSWVIRYAIDSKRTDFTLGTWPSLSLDGAIIKAQEVRNIIASGENPAAHRKAMQWSRIESSSACTVQEVFEEWIIIDKRISKSSYQSNIESALKAHVLPAIGQKNLSDVSVGNIIDIIQSIENHGHFEMSKRVLMWLFQLFDFAIVNRKN